MAEHADPTKNNKDIPHEAKDGDVHQPKPGANSSAVARLKMLLAHDRTPPVEQVAEIIVRYPHKHEHDAVIEFLHQHFGASFVQKVLASTKHGDKQDKAQDNAAHAHEHDESFAQHGKKATGGELRTQDEATAGNKHKSADPNRMTHDHHAITLGHDTEVYRGDGSAYDAHVVKDEQKGKKPDPTKAPAIIHAKAHDKLRVETGAVKTLNVADEHGKVSPQICVLCIQVGTTAVTGWVPLWAIDKQFHSQIKTEDTRIAHHLDNAGGKEDYSANARRVQLTAAPHPHARTEPNQDPKGGANEAVHYYARPGGVVNLLANVPASGGGRFGVPIDVLTENTEFFESTTVAREHTPLWKSGKNGDQTDEKITFAYGKINTQAGPKYGWINVACLS